MSGKKFSRFSVPLGLLDYVNPVLYTITMVTIIRNTQGSMGQPYCALLLIGAIVSIFFGFIIPTGKVIVGLGIIQFRMPVSLVFCVNTGILMSGLMLFHFVMNPGLVLFLILIAAIVCLLIGIWRQTKKLNTIAVLIGAFGYLLIYTSLITLSIRKAITIPIILYAMAIMLFVMLCGIGIKANLKNPKVHWVIEISNVVCQLLVAVATVMAFT